MNKLNHKYN